MAGLGFKDFSVGEVLTSADVDGYLMQQTIMRFADATARGSALGTAAGTSVALAEGMTSYLDDVNRIEVFDGSVWKPTGAVLQVVQAVKTDTFTTTSTSYVDVTDLSVTITPSSTSSKILVLLDIKTSSDGSGTGVHTQLVRGATAIYIGDAASNRVRSTVSTTGAVTFDLSSGVGMFMDSPATTSATTYKAQIRRGFVTGAGSAFVNRFGSDLDDAARGRTASSITVIEVAG